MPDDQIRYDLLTQEALRGVVRGVIGDAAKRGLPGNHHFFVSFDTRAPGVRLSPRLRAQYPQEMTIVLQHQFWDLTVTEEEFEVGLSFGGVAERLGVPFAAISGFFDPSVQFGLQFQDADKASENADNRDDAAVPVPDAEERRKGKGGTSPTERVERPRPKLAEVPSDARQDTGSEPDPAQGGAEVVRLDRFRKK